MRTVRRGTTLIELIATLVVLGLVAGVATIGVGRIQATPVHDPTTIAAESLRVAIAESRTITFGEFVGDRWLGATVSPDGSVVADTTIHLDALSGRPTDAH